MAQEDDWVELHRPHLDDPDAPPPGPTRAAGPHARHRAVVEADRRIARIVQDVPVPVGLSSRVAERLEAASRMPATTAAAEVTPPRRRGLRPAAGVAFAAVAVVLFLAVMVRPLAWPPGGAIDLDRVVADAVELFDRQDLTLCASVEDGLLDAIQAQHLEGCEERRVSGQPARVYWLRDRNGFGGRALVIVMDRAAVERGGVQFTTYQNSVEQVLVSVFEPSPGSDRVFFMVVRQPHDFGVFLRPSSLT